MSDQTFLKELQESYDKALQQTIDNIKIRAIEQAKKGSKLVDVSQEVSTHGYFDLWTALKKEGFKPKPESLKRTDPVDGVYWVHSEDMNMASFDHLLVRK